MTQVHDFNPGIAPNGLFWTVQVPDDAVKITEDTLTISLKNVAVLDQISFPNNIFLGSTGAPALLSLDITYTRVEHTRHHVRATSADPVSPFNWAGEMSDATYSGTFSVAYTDGKFAAQGSFGSTPALQVFAEMGTERNGSFVRQEDQDEDAIAAAALLQDQASSILAASALSALGPTNSPKIRGKIPAEYLVH